MAGEKSSFVTTINDTDPSNNGKSYKCTISGTNYNQLLGKTIGDAIDGIFIGEGEITLAGYTLEISGGSDKTGTPMRNELLGGALKEILVTASQGYKGHKIVNKKSKRYRYKPDGLRKRRTFRGATITQDTRQINLKVVKHGNKSLAEIFPSSTGDSASED
ncbi:MAG TPA: 30S ribosomal protein S6e [Candidatus Poseidoniales archaeon]|jgi:small subunit ribosomal protein S6e|nr:MAG: 30S ribosomal protein S6e [Euryarchaeota archaeon]HIG02879.1 30S ribosomal protein S6e [Candidatus Poseidoniales archaeon]HIK78337.1 30S ribosomal protein S6e [Candidatus Poseidoniales archaeon]